MTPRACLSLLACALLACAGDAAGGPAAEAKGSAGAAAEAVEYHRDVDPILRAHCTGCHHEGGSAPFALDGFRRAQPLADEIARATRARRMPPWPPQASEDCPELVGVRGLQEREIALLTAWAEAGAPEGEASARPEQELPEQPVEELQRVDAVLQSAEPYRPTPWLDDHRCFAVDPQLNGDRYLTAYAVRQDVPGIVHHVQLWALDDPAADAELDALDARDPGPGYACPYGHALAARYVSVWAPSAPVRRHPEGTGVPLRAGRRMLIQIHYHDRLGLGLHDRTAIELELTEQVAHPADMWTVANTNISLPPGQAYSTVLAASAVPSGRPVQLWGVRPHMHALGRDARLRVREGGATRCLLSVPRWDPAWQLMYFYADPIVLAPGQTLEVECGYDTRYQKEAVNYGIGTKDEMCFGFFYVTGSSP